MGISISAELKNKLEHWPVKQVLVWAYHMFNTEVAVTSSFQTQSLPLLHMLSRYCPGIPIFFIDTGYHFSETLEYRDALTAALDLNVHSIQNEIPPKDFSAKFGDLYQTDPDTCCILRKVAPLKEALSNYRVWISGIRRDQINSRKHTEIIEELGDLIKINPLVFWPHSQIEAYIREHQLPRHPLTKQGFVSIGCAPCTRALKDHQSWRDGRWVGFPKTECGMHSSITVTDKKQFNFLED